MDAKRQKEELTRRSPLGCTFHPELHARGTGSARHGNQFDRLHADAKQRRERQDAREKERKFALEVSLCTTVFREIDPARWSGD